MPRVRDAIPFEAILLGLVRERLRRIDIPRDLLTNVLRRLAAEG